MVCFSASVQNQHIPTEKDVDVALDPIEPAAPKVSSFLKSAFLNGHSTDDSVAPAVRNVSSFIRQRKQQNNTTCCTQQDAKVQDVLTRHFSKAMSWLKQVKQTTVRNSSTSTSTPLLRSSTKSSTSGSNHFPV